MSCSLRILDRKIDLEKLYKEPQLLNQMEESNQPNDLKSHIFLDIFSNRSRDKIIENKPLTRKTNLMVTFVNDIGLSF